MCEVSDVCEVSIESSDAQVEWGHPSFLVVFFIIELEPASQRCSQS